MKIVFLSNYFNHHQKPLSDALARSSDYAFVATEPMTQERRALGWGGDTEPDYVCSYEREPVQAEQLLAQADVVIVGSAPEKLVRECIKRNQPVLRYEERPLKQGGERWKYIPRWIKWHMQNPTGKPIWLLCASAYTAADYARFGLFRGKAFRWGYFPEAKQYAHMEALLDGKKKASILWVGRFLDWKHPDDAVRLAKRLRNLGLDFEMNIIGRGEMEDTLWQMIEEEKLQGQVQLLGAMAPEAVRRYMEQSQIFLFTSDRREGWGAVLNEAMNSGCAVAASHAIGAVPYMLRNGENGCVYRSGDMDALAECVGRMLSEPQWTRQLGIAACKTVTDLWNGEVAARRLLRLLECLTAGENAEKLYADGPCSPAPIMREDWFEQ